jgi:hypothetical protein
MDACANGLCPDLLDGAADAIHAALSADARGRYSAQELA